MIPTEKRAARRLPSPEGLKLFVELEAPTNRDLEVARDWFDECRNLADIERAWEAVNQLEAVAAKTYGVPDVHQTRVEGTPAAATTPTSQMRSRADVSEGDG